MGDTAEKRKDLEVKLDALERWIKLLIENRLEEPSHESAGYYLQIKAERETLIEVLLGDY